MASALVYCKDGLNREKISKALAPLGFRSSFTSDTASVTRLIAEISPVLYMQDWHSLDLSRSAQILRLIDNTDIEGKMLRIICAEAVEPNILAIATETGVRKVISYAALGLDFKKLMTSLQLGPSEAQKLGVELRKLREAGKTSEAEKYIEAAYVKDKRSPDIRIEYANLLFHRGDLTAATTMAKSLLAEDENNVRAMNLLSRIAMKSGDFAAATQVLERANVLSPKNPERLALLGNAYYGKGDKAKAAGAFSDALKEDPKSKGAVQGLGTIKLETGDSDALVELFNAHSSEAETAGFFNNAAVQNVRAGKLEDGLKLYEIALKALKSDQYRALIYFNMALNYRRLKNYDEALKAAKRALRYNSAFAKADNQIKELEALLAKKKSA